MKTWDNLFVDYTLFSQVKKSRSYTTSYSFFLNTEKETINLFSFYTCIFIALYINRGSRPDKKVNGKKEIVEISQNSQENASARVSFFY